MLRDTSGSLDWNSVIGHRSTIMHDRSGTRIQAACVIHWIQCCLGYMTYQVAPQLANDVHVAQRRKVWCPSTSMFLWLVTLPLECGLGITTLGSVYTAGPHCLTHSTPPSCQLKPCESACPAWTSAISASSPLTRPPTSSWMSLLRTQIRYPLQSALLTCYRNHITLCLQICTALLLAHNIQARASATPDLVNGVSFQQSSLGCVHAQGNAWV